MAVDTTRDVVADIGGTHARFAAVRPGETTLDQLQVLRCRDFPSISSAIHHYLDSLDVALQVRSLCLAVAGPVETDHIDLPNNAWSFSQRALARELGCELLVINDFTAQMYGVLTLGEQEVDWIGRTGPLEGLVIAALGPGTGLGAAGLTPHGEIIPSEAGHLAFAPTTQHELDVLQLLWKDYPRLSVERLLSGPGLCALHRANSILAGTPPATLAPEAVSVGARNGDPVCLASLQDFIAILGSVAGELALALGARGGVYLCGGILPGINGLYDPAVLRERFNDKGRFRQYCCDIPLALVRAEHNGLRGCVQTVNRGNTRT